MPMEPSPLAFLFLDECSDEALDLAALTGVLVPHEKYRNVRDAMCKVVYDVLEPPANTVPAPIELHGRNLLPQLDNLPVEQADAARLHVFRRVAGIINEYGLLIFRVCYLNRSEIANVLKGDPKLYSLNFLGIQTGLQDLMETTLIVPVMDGVPNSADAKKPPSIDPSLIRAFAGSVRWLHHARQSEIMKNSLSIRNSHNLAEPVFADSTHSTMLQLVDLISYLLLQQDRDELAPQSISSQFKQAVVNEAKAIDPRLLASRRDQMKFQPFAHDMRNASL